MKNEKIVYIATNPWNDIWRRRHQIISRIAKNNKVLWVEPPLNLFSSSAVSRIKLKRLVEFLWNPREEKKNVFIFPLINILPFIRFSVIKKLNRFIYLFFLKKAIRSLELTKPVLWVTFNWSFEHFIGELEEKFVVYDCFDKCTGFVAAQRDIKKMRKIQMWEDEVVERSNIVFAASEVLKKDLDKFNVNVFTVPNGVDFDHFKKALDSDTEIPFDIKGINRPIIGEMGIHGRAKIDIDTIKFIAENRIDWSIVIIGPILPSIPESEINKLKKCENVYLLGMKKYKLLPKYLKAIDVLLMTFNIDDELIKVMTHPDRLFEFMAAGKPIVTTRLSEIDKYKDVLKIADNKEEFIPLIEQSLKENSNRLIQKRINLAKQNTWDKRVELVSRLIAQQL